MSARPPHYSLAAQTATALGFAFVLWSGVCVLGSPAASLRHSHDGSLRRFTRIDIACSYDRSAGDSDSSGPALQVSAPQPPVQADVVHLAEQSDAAFLVTSCSVLRTIPQDQTILAASPDHLIELPGTPPPALV